MKIEGTIIVNMDYDNLLDLKHNMKITLGNHGCDSGLIDECVDRILQDLKLSGITLNGVMD